MKRMLAGLACAWLAAAHAESLPPLTDVAEVALGEQHTCILDARGSASCWGSNEFGQLGLPDGARTARTTPVPIPGARPGLSHLAVGDVSACAITAAGGVTCWGWDASGVLGDGPGEGGPAPVAVDLAARAITDPIQLAVGVAHACVLTRAGGVYCWGDNGSGQLGDDGRMPQRDVPFDVLDLGGQAIAIDAGDEHTCAVMAFNEVHCWGDNDFGQLGDGTTTDRDLPVTVQGLPANVEVKQLALGGRSSCALLQNGAVYCWGPQYPLAAFEGGSLVAKPYPGFESGWVGIDAGTFHYCALNANGAVKCFGDGSNGQFGNGPIDGSLGVDTAVGLSPNITQIAAGGFHTCARAQSGGLQCWGLNTKGQLGLDNTTRRLVPTQVVGLTGGIADVAAGNFHSCALTTGGAVKCWGANNQSSLGDGTDRFRLTPVDVVGLTSGVRALSAGNEHNCVITAARRVKCWGANYDGRLGNGGNINSNVPVDVVGLGEVDVLAITSGDAHNCALLQGGAVKCWGVNSAGQLGDGTVTDRSTPVDVSGLQQGVTAIAAGYAHTCAVVNGGLKCWGANGVGQLGDASTANRTTPANVSGLASGVLAVGAGEQHTCAIVTGGAVKCWGFNFFGVALGDGSTADRAVPGDVPALRTGVAQIALGGYTTCVRMQDGAMQCWGSNGIGDNTELSRPFPTPVAGLESGVTAIDVGFGGQICAVVSGAAKCWMENAFGQLGDGTTHGVPEPRIVRTDDVARRVGAVSGEGNDVSVASASDASGRYVVFQSKASNLVAGDTNNAVDVFRTDRQTRETVRVSVDDGEQAIEGDSIEPSVSADGNLVVFVAFDAAVAKTANARPKASGWGVYMRNLVTGNTTRVGTASTNGAGTQPRIAPNGGAVVYTSNASGKPDVYVTPLAGVPPMPGTVRCVSCKVVDASGAEGADTTGASRNAVISADGRLVAFESTAKNALASSPSPCPGTSSDILLRNLVTGQMQRMSPTPGTPPANCGTVGSTAPSLDYAGDTVAFQTDQPLAGGDDNGVADVYVVQTEAPAAPLRVSRAPDGADANGASSAPELSGDGASVAFVSGAANLDLDFADNNDRADVHVATLSDAGVQLQRLSRGTSGAEADAPSDRPALNYDGTKVSFDSAARTLAGLVNGQANVYQRSNPLAPAVKSATYWRSSETGWGLTVFDQGNVLAPAWFTYDSDGEPTWFLTAGAFPQADGSWKGDLLRLRGTPFAQIEGPAVQSATNVGNVVLRFQGDKALDFDYTVQGSTQHKTLVPFPYGARTFACTASPTAARDNATNYSDLWTGATANAGWGLTIFHVDDSVFAGWYTYDTDGEAVFFVLATTRQADGSFKGPIFRQRNGVPFTQIDNAPSSAGTDPIGEATLRFTDGDSASFTYTVGATTQTKAIVRLLVGNRPSVCQTTDVANR